MNLGQAPLNSIWLTLQDKSDRILGSDSLNMDILFQSALVVFYALCKFLSCDSLF